MGCFRALIKPMLKSTIPITILSEMNISSAMHNDYTMKRLFNKELISTISILGMFIFVKLYLL